MNAATFQLTAEQLADVGALPFVERIAPVRSVRVTIPPVKEIDDRTAIRKTTGLSYGASAQQVQAVNAVDLHNAGITGKGVLVGMLDNGFRWRVHEALNTRHVIAEHDFIFNDDTTSNQAGDVGNQDAHGTATMSVVGGYMPGKLIGPAFGVDFVLGKTEDMRSETKAEEDNWAAAIEWMEGLGVDIVSSSLGYNTFDFPDTSYSWANGSFDGRTTITAKAAIRAARLGVVVVNAMGNEGNGDGTTGTLTTPSDADSILSSGAVNFARTLAGFSSTGPTNDGRTKPDVVAPGVGVYTATTPNVTSYTYQGGTSFSTPLTAASAALMLSARPELNAIAIRDIIRNTADPVSPSHPNNFTGWGHVNALKATLASGPVFSNVPDVEAAGGLSTVHICVLSRNGIKPASVQLYYAPEPDTDYVPLTMSLDTAIVYPTSGWYSATIPSMSFGTHVRFYVVAEDSSALSYRSPAPVRGTSWQIEYGVTGIVAGQDIPASFVVKRNYPNPFNPYTMIEFALPKRQHVTLKVYDILGREVATLVDGTEEAGTKRVRFDGAGLASGVYIYRIEVPGSHATGKMLLMR
jgi:hypothetical protein